MVAINESGLRFNPKSLRRVVIKVGSSSIILNDGMVRLGFLGKLVTTISKLLKRGTEVVLVSSGAIAMGYKRLGMDKRPVHMEDKQACASVGQSELMALYQSLFWTLGIHVGQVLLTRDDLEDRRRYINARETLSRLLELGVVPIVNENDSVSVDEIKFGDNDELSALVSGLIDADLLVLLTDVDGLYDDNPKANGGAHLISRIEPPVSRLLELAADGESSMGTGGMRSKLDAADHCSRYGIPCVIAKGRGSVLEAALSGEEVGTFVLPMDNHIGSRGRWIAKAAGAQGKLIMDAGATRAMTEGAGSLLPIGVTGVEGRFLRGAVVILADPHGNEVGRGVVRYGADDLRMIIGKPGEVIEDTLGFTFGDRIVHRNDFVLTLALGDQI